MATLRSAKVGAQVGFLIWGIEIFGILLLWVNTLAFGHYDWNGVVVLAVVLDSFVGLPVGFAVLFGIVGVE
jgi:hypothetical protein